MMFIQDMQLRFLTFLHQIDTPISSTTLPTQDSNATMQYFATSAMQRSSNLIK
jgi:hypothetical protein